MQADSSAEQVKSLTLLGGLLSCYFLTEGTFSEIII